MKVALVHDWLVSVGGGEKFLQNLYELFPSPIYTLVQNQKNLKNTFFGDKEIFSSFIQKFPFAKTHHRWFLPFFPLAIEQFDLSKYDVILSSSHAVAKGVLTHAEQLHICYCHTPMRYAWDLYHQYLTETNLHKSFVLGKMARLFLHYLRMWDVQSASRVDYYVANSKFVAKRILKIYGKKAEVIYSGIDTDYFSFCPKKEDFYLTASRMVPYKKMDVIVDAFSRMPDKKLVVIGEGPEFSKIKAKAKKNVFLLGHQTDDQLKGYLQKAKGFVFAAIEDFGLLPVEAQSVGTPVIALGKGGVLETVVEGQTGLFFPEQTAESIMEAIQKFEKKEWDYQLARQQGERFGKETFQKNFKNFVEKSYEKFQSDL